MCLLCLLDRFQTEGRHLRLYPISSVPHLVDPVLFFGARIRKKYPDPYFFLSKIQQILETVPILNIYYGTVVPT